MFSHKSTSDISVSMICMKPIFKMCHSYYYFTFERGPESSQKYEIDSQNELSELRIMLCIYLRASLSIIWSGLSLLKSSKTFSPTTFTQIIPCVQQSPMSNCLYLFFLVSDHHRYPEALSSSCLAPVLATSSLQALPSRTSNSPDIHMLDSGCKSHQL